ncbi:ParM/StbA family protein [Nitrosophilus labii]|uniref:ParM/StbA family protein n=1 Tax=Nitrosophilus labii TaxID=2706014 RepID=UPI00165690D3|nr:ParM/StbA family protein [Nitrosophilus labii]
MQKIAIDIGYGDTKVVTKDQQFKFASAIEKKREAMADYGSAQEDVYEYGGKKYTVGDKALANAVSTRGFNFLVKYSPLIIYHAIKKAGLNTKEPIHIVTGLSIVNWNEKEHFIEAIKTININDEVIKPKIKLMAQGQGIFYDYKGDKNGIVCIVDIGYNTFDFLVFEDGDPRPDLSFATKKGANVVITELQTKIKKKFNADITEQMAKDIFTTGYFMNYGEKIDLTDEIEDAKIDYTDFILDEMKSQRSDLLRSATKVIFSGGGAYFLEGAKLPKNVDFSEKPYEFANARGYYEKG